MFTLALHMWWKFCFFNWYLLSTVIAWVWAFAQLNLRNSCCFASTSFNVILGKTIIKFSCSSANRRCCWWCWRYCAIMFCTTVLYYLALPFHILQRFVVLVTSEQCIIYEIMCLLNFFKIIPHHNSKYSFIFNSPSSPVSAIHTFIHFIHSFTLL